MRSSARCPSRPARALTLKGGWQMKPIKILLAVIPALALTACAVSTKSGDPGKLRVQAPSPDVMAGCQRPAEIPSAATTQGAQETIWRRDRLALADCADKHKVAVEWIEGLAGEFSPEVAQSRPPPRR